LVSAISLGLSQVWPYDAGREIVTGPDRDMHLESAKVAIMPFALQH